MSTDATLTKIERNTVLQAIRALGLDPHDFDLGKIERLEYVGYSPHTFICSRLLHRPTEYYFIFGAHVVQFAPGSVRKIDAAEHHDSWNIKENQLERWLIRVKEDHEAPDLWAEVGKERALADAASSMVENLPFASGEQAQIAMALTEIKQYLLTIREAQGDQGRFIEAQFGYLNDSMTRLGRKDWLNILFSTLLSTAFNLALPPENVKGLMQFSAATLQWLVGQAQGLIQ